MIELKKAVRRVTLTHKTEYLEGKVGNCRWRCFGPDCASDARGQLQLANATDFELWSNSLMITVDCARFINETRSPNRALENLVKVFD